MDDWRHSLFYMHLICPYRQCKNRNGKDRAANRVARARMKARTRRLIADAYANG